MEAGTGGGQDEPDPQLGPGGAGGWSVSAVHGSGRPRSDAWTPGEPPSPPGEGNGP